MKTNSSRAEIEKFAASLVARGWSVTVENDIEQYMSPMSQLGEWVTVTIFGRNVRTVTSYNMKNTKCGLVDARIAAANFKG